ncbi:MAG TPA: DUF4097 family beta strand repeat-containing protein [Longimicrobium sp.]|nr:DUF4097 family beta strand repeat-containing protein [Longimicrobium sp.]
MLSTLVLLAALQQPAALDTTLAVRPSTRLEVQLSAGSIRVSAWDRDAVRVQARPRGQAAVDVRLAGSVLNVTGRAPQGSAVEVADVEVTAPRWMDLKLGRGDVDITVTGSQGSIDASNYDGDISVDGGRGVVILQSTLGAVTLRRARGRVSASATHEPVTISDVVGDVEAESDSKQVTLARIDSRNVRATSVGGAIRFSGPFHPDGRYSFSTHMGSIWAWVPAPANATLSVATVNGGFGSDFPHTVTERTRRMIFTARVGDGSAQVQMESFSGGIFLRRLVPGAPEPH